MSKPASHRLDVYDVDIHLVTKQSQLTKVLADITDDPVEWNSLGQVQTYHGGEMGKEVSSFVLVVCLDHKLLRKDRELMVKTVAHEATHAACFVLDHIGQEYDGGSESLAYLVGWLTWWLWDNL